MNYSNVQMVFILMFFFFLVSKKSFNLMLTLYEAYLLAAIPAATLRTL